MEADNSIIFSAADRLMNIVLDLASDLDEIKINKSERKTISAALIKYVRHYKNLYGSLRIFGMSNSISLESIYTKVQLLNAEQLKSFETIDALEKQYRQTKKRKFPEIRKPISYTSVEISNTEQYLLILGDPGAGKTTFLKKIWLESIKGKRGKYDHICIPVYIELKHFDVNISSLDELILNEFNFCGLPCAESIVKTCLNAGKFLILLDGLDEVQSSKLENVLKCINNAVRDYYDNRFIVSCRTAAYNNYLNNFRNVKISNFGDVEIEQFIDNWFQSDLDKKASTGDQFWELLRSPENSATKELAQTPLLLTFLCLVYDRSQKLPDNRSTLYKKALDILLEEWESEKRVKRDKIYKGFHSDLEKILLSKIAYDALVDDKLFFSEQSILTNISEFLSKNLNAPSNLNSKTVLRAIEIQQGLLVERAEDVYSFSHLTLQEYLVAQYISERNIIKNIVSEYFLEVRWHQVFTLLSGLLGGGAYQLLQAIEAETHLLLKSPKLKRLIKWADNATKDSRSECKPAARRAAAIDLAHSLDRALSRALTTDKTRDLARIIDSVLDKALKASRDFSLNPRAAQNVDPDLQLARLVAKDFTRDLDLDLTLALVLEKIHIFNSVRFTPLINRLGKLRNRIPDPSDSQQKHMKFAKHIKQLSIVALELDPDLVELSSKEAADLKKYIYANRLLVECKNSAISIDKDQWNRIEDRMLTIPDKNYLA